MMLTTATLPSAELQHPDLDTDSAPVIPLTTGFSTSHAAVRFVD
jgi:hypothetical protein